MGKHTDRVAISGQFVVGRRLAEKISAVEGIVRSPRTGSLIEASDLNRDTGQQRRQRIRDAFAKRS